jgi:hypothetical protein
MPKLTVTGTNIDAPDAHALADFYCRLLGWTPKTEEPGWVILQPPGGGQTLNFQTEERYVRPVWPPGQIVPGIAALRGDLGRKNSYC